jgi:hypothetical protein
MAVFILGKITSYQGAIKASGRLIARLNELVCVEDAAAVARFTSTTSPPLQRKGLSQADVLRKLIAVTFLISTRSARGFLCA